MSGEWYDAVSPESLYEGDFEDLLLANAETLYPGFFVVRFKKTVFSEYGAGRPDLALIERNYRNWWVGEVELGTHPVREHVERQVAIFSTAHYDVSVADYLLMKNESLESPKLRDMLLGSQPRVFVIVNQSVPEWGRVLAKWDAIVGVAEVFRSRQNRSILRINGDSPQSAGDLLSLCRVDPVLPSFLIVDSPASLGVASSERVEVWLEDSVTEWIRRDSSTTVWLIPARRCPLRAEIRSYALLRRDDGRLVLQSHNLLKEGRR